MPTIVCDCGQKLDAPDSAIGKHVRCPKCQAVLKVNAPDTPSPLQAAPVQATPLQAPPEPNLYSDSPGQAPASYAPQQFNTGNRKSSGPNVLLIAGITLGALVLLVGIGVAAYLFNGDHSDVVDARMLDNDADSKALKGYSVSPVDPAEARRVAELVISAFEEGGRRADLDASFDFNELVNRATHGISLPSSEKAEFLRGLQTGGFKQRQFAELEALAQSGSCRLLRVHADEGETRAVCRFNSAEGGVMYIDFIFHTDDGGRVRISDYEPVTTGAMVSLELRNILLDIMKANQNAIAKMVTGDSVLAEHIDEIKEMGQLANTNPQRALQIFNALPKEVQDQKYILLRAINITANLDADTYLEILQRFLDKYPGTTAAKVHSIDYYLLTEEYEKCIKAVRELDELVGGDAATNPLAAAAYLMMGEPEKAMQEHLTAIERDPEFAESYIELIAGYMIDGKFDLVNKYIKDFETNCSGWEIDYSVLENFDAFRQSPQFKEFQNR